MHTFGLPSLLLVLLLIGCTESEDPPDRQVISTDAAPEALGPYSQAIQVGNTIYCSGQIGIDPTTDSLVAGGVEAETRQALENLRSVLESAGFSLEDVVRTQVFLADLDDYAAMNEVYSTYFDAASPARAAVQAAGIPAGARVEITVTARK
ncbi:MAG: RidA family protein [Salinibacter sp.]|uniref:RidA family protein n=1 Tax=Salinibacter sp. TaxID=2065818 RepID=UPI0035D49312